MKFNEKYKEYIREATKMDQPDYKYYVVVDGKIETGWENREDAKDQLDELPPNKKGKVVAKVTLKKMDLEPERDSDWVCGVNRITEDTSIKWTKSKSDGLTIYTSKNGEYEIRQTYEGDPEWTISLNGNHIGDSESLSDAKDIVTDYEKHSR